MYGMTPWPWVITSFPIYPVRKFRPTHVTKNYMVVKSCTLTTFAWMKHPSKMKAVFQLKCPRCRKGTLFITPCTFKTAYQGHEHCPICHLKFEKEPGFWWGAMFISYGITGWLFLAIGLILVFTLGWTLIPTLIVVALITVLVHNLIFRLSRSIWISFFENYDPTVLLKETTGSKGA